MAPLSGRVTNLHGHGDQFGRGYAALEPPDIIGTTKWHFWMIRSLPGLALCAAIAAVGYALQSLQIRLMGQAYVEALVLAILVGTAVRAAWSPALRWQPGIAISAKYFLELAVVFLGASVDLHAVTTAGPVLPMAVACVVAVALAGGYGIGRVLGLPPRLAVLVASGNAICGNSAIAAIAPVVGACSEDIASSIAFTAVLGVGVVLALPLLAAFLHLSAYSSGILAGMTVYAVPQVLAATAPMGPMAVQVGTMVKLLRVLMLGPAVVALSLLMRRACRPEMTTAPSNPRAAPSLSLGHWLPWFILGFLGLALLRSLGALPNAVQPPVAAAARLLSVIAMAALGLGVELRALRRVGAPAVLAVTGSLLMLVALAFGAIRVLAVA